MVGDCGHDLVGFMGLIRWVSVVLDDDFNGVEIGVVGFVVAIMAVFFFFFLAVVCGSGFGST